MKTINLIDSLPSIIMATKRAKYYTPELGVSTKQGKMRVNYFRQYGSGRVDIIPVTEWTDANGVIEFLDSTTINKGFRLATK
jgi:hypothetical protein